MTERPESDSPLADQLDSDDDASIQLAASKPRRRQTNPAHVTEFFDRFHDKIEAMANELNIDKRLILAIGAYESGWFQDDPKNNNYSRSNNNFFGYSKNEIPMKFDQVDENIRQWKNKWGAILRDVGDDREKLLDRMLRPPINPRTGKPAYEAYNQREGYEPELRGVIKTIYNRLPIWNVDQMEKAMSSPKN